MAVLVTFLDACVLYPAQLRNLFMRLAAVGLYHPRWSDAVHEEWMRAVGRDHPDITRPQLERIRDLMNAHAPDCTVAGYEALVPAFALPDPDDRHVLAAAVTAGAACLVTFNLADFPPAVTLTHGVEPVHPDEFVSRLLAERPGDVCDAVRRQRASLKKPPKTAAELLAALEQCRLPRTVAGLRQFEDLI